MNLNQIKLSKSEWNAIEVPVSDKELSVLQIIKNGYQNVNIKHNDSLSLFSFLKIEHSAEMEDHLYNIYFGKKVKSISKKYDCSSLVITANSSPTIKKADLIRLQKNDPEKMNPENAFEYLLLDEVEAILKYHKKEKKNKWMFHYFTLRLKSVK